MDLELQEKTVLVAGSTRGIGRAIAYAFLREGASVVVTGRDPVGVTQTRAALAAEFDGRRIHGWSGDLTREEDIEACLAASGRIDGLVAGIGSGTGTRGWDVDAAEWSQLLETNLLGSMVLARAAAARLGAGGTITFVASIAGLEVIDAPLGYGAAKAALVHATKGLAHALAPRGVRVNAVAPGNVLAPGGVWERKLAENRGAVERMLEREVPLRRFARPEEVADAVVFLASARASFVTGVCLVVDGGQTRGV